MPTVVDIAWLTLMVAMMGLMVVGAIRHTRQIGDGRASPLIAPDWTSIERPVSPLPIDWGPDDPPEIEDDHVGRPFPPTAQDRVGSLSLELHDRRPPR